MRKFLSVLCACAIMGGFSACGSSGGKGAKSKEKAVKEEIEGLHSGDVDKIMNLIPESCIEYSVNNKEISESQAIELFETYIKEEKKESDVSDFEIINTEEVEKTAYYVKAAFEMGIDTFDEVCMVTYKYKEDDKEERAYTILYSIDGRWYSGTMIALFEQVVGD